MSEFLEKNDFFKTFTPLKGDYVFGNIHNKKSLNVKKELKRLEKNPLRLLFKKISKEKVEIFRNELVRQDEAYYLFYLSMERFLKTVSLSIRFNRRLHYKVKNGYRLTASERTLKKKYQESSRFTEFDFFNCLIHARILLDRTASLSRHFLSEPQKPSFTSFSDHKKFFKRLTVPYGLHEEYASYLRSNTDWFEFPLKAIRDKFIVHNSPRHMQHFGFPGGDMTDLCLIYIVPDNPEGDLRKVKMINVSMITLSRDICKFLKWFSKYGVKDSSQRTSLATSQAQPSP